MQVIKNTTGSKAVKISTTGSGQVAAMYVQFDSLNFEQLLQAKYFATVKAAEKWAAKRLA